MYTQHTRPLTIIARLTVTRVAIDKVCALPMATRVRSTVIDIVLTERASKASQTLTAGLSRWHPTASAVVLTWIVFLTNVYLLTLTACTWRGYKNWWKLCPKIEMFKRTQHQMYQQGFQIVFRSISTEKEQKLSWLSFKMKNVNFLLLLQPFPWPCKWFKTIDLLWLTGISRP